MKSLTRKDAEHILEIAEKKNPGSWVTRSKEVAKVSEILAGHLGADPEKSYIYGLLYDIGRIKGNTGIRHIVDGYHYLKEELELAEEFAKCTLTHSYLIKDASNILGEKDMTGSELTFVQDYLDQITFDIYDEILQLADNMTLPTGPTLVERRILDLYLRYGVDGKTVLSWKALFNLQKRVEEQLGHSIYTLFPEAIQWIPQYYIKDVLKF